MKLSVTRINEPGREFRCYRYQIYVDGKPFGIFAHNYRGEAESFTLHGGYNEDPPFGMSASFLTGGGPKPLGLTAEAKLYLKKLVQTHGLPS